jgi:hypothetical protein
MIRIRTRTFSKVGSGSVKKSSESATLGLKQFRLHNMLKCGFQLIKIKFYSPLEWLSIQVPAYLNQLRQIRLQ